MTAYTMAARAILFEMIKTGGDRRRVIGNVRREVRTWKSRHRDLWQRQCATRHKGGNTDSKDQILLRPKSGRQRGRPTHESYENGADQHQDAARADEGPHPPWCPLAQGRRDREAKMQRPDDVFMRRGRESRHIRSYKDDEDSQQGLDLNPPGVAQKNGIARLHLQRWQQLALKTFRDKQNAGEESELNAQQVP